MNSSSASVTSTGITRCTVTTWSRSAGILHGRKAVQDALAELETGIGRTYHGNDKKKIDSTRRLCSAGLRLCVGGGEEEGDVQCCRDLSSSGSQNASRTGPRGDAWPPCQSQTLTVPARTGAPAVFPGCYADYSRGEEGQLL